MIIADSHFLVYLDGAPLYPAHGDSAHILVVVDGGHQQLQRGSRVAGGGGDIVDNGLKQGNQVLALLVGAVGGGALPSGAEHGGGVELLVGGVQVQQQLQHLVHHLVNPGVGLVNLVDGHNYLVTQLQGLLQHKTGLGHGAFGGVHQQNNAVDHLQDPLHLAAKVSVARSVHDVDFVVFVPHGGVLGQDGDATLPFQISRVHDPLHSGLVLPVNTALLQHFVHQGGLAVVDMGDNGDIANFLLGCHIRMLLK